MNSYVIANQRKMGVPKTIYIVAFILAFGVMVTLINIWQLRTMQRPDGGYLDHILAVFKRLGFVRAEQGSDWDVLWHHDYPFLNEKMRPILTNLKPHQRVNHIPGSGYYTSKVNLATSNITGIPPAFGLPKDKKRFLKFARAHPDKYWVQKSNKHRGIEIKKVDELNLEQENSFIQEYISNPLLIDGRSNGPSTFLGDFVTEYGIANFIVTDTKLKFDIGVYTIVTSMHPLRVYVLFDNALFRFCPEDYEPFDPDNTDKYVIGDDYTPMWEIKSLKKYYKDMNLSFKESFNLYVQHSLKKDPNVVWDGIFETIRQTLLSKQTEFGPLHKKYQYHWNFFELSRFDFVVDEDLNVFLMEANMSPNLSSGHFSANKYLYEQVVFNLLAVVGVARYVHSSTLAIGQEDIKAMRVSDKDIQVPQACMNDCKTGGCDEPRCQFCQRCVTEERRESLKRAYLEHVNRRGTRRIIPPPFIDDWGEKMVENAEEFEKYIDFWLHTEDDKMVAWWFRGKCKQDQYWCS